MKKEIRLNENEFKSLLKHSIKGVLKEDFGLNILNEDDEYYPSCDDIAQEIRKDPSQVSIGQGKTNVFLDVNGHGVDVYITTNMKAYVKKGKYYGYYELEDPDELVKDGTPEIIDVTYSIDNGAEQDDDGSIMAALEELLTSGMLSIDYGEMDLYPSEEDYYYNED